MLLLMMRVKNKAFNGIVPRGTRQDHGLHTKKGNVMRGSKEGEPCPRVLFRGERRLVAGATVLLQASLAFCP